MTINADRLVPALGLPLSTVPRWGGHVVAGPLTFILHPPIDFELAYRVPEQLLFLPFGPVRGELAIGDGPLVPTRMRAGSCLVVAPETLIRTRQAAPVEFLVVTAEAGIVAELTRRLDRATAGWPLPTENDVLDPAVTALAQEVRRAMLGDVLVDPRYLGLLGEALLARLICRHFARSGTADAGPALPPGRLRRVLTAIEDGLADGVRVSQLAAMTNLSRAHFSRAFEQATGLSPRQFLQERRLARARALIAAGAPDLAAVAAESGFSSHAHMASAFRKRLGVSPSRYRAAFAGAYAPASEACSPSMALA